MPNRPRPGISIAPVAIVALALGLAAIGRGEPPRARPAPQDAKVKAGPPTPEWATAQSCFTCHRQQKQGEQEQQSVLASPRHLPGLLRRFEPERQH